ncbi:hypothetical protein MH050_16430 [Bacillus licheniformis]|uniref:hypothetical protein n=1 Tax=Bacillus licheniformis TaxID=1402 RepID=UPI002282734A|nr:hypothetical protein [Bacillus licheniformis]MCY7742400.1 hypothetical protein [Bacillus licheniformis]
MTIILTIIAAVLVIIGLVVFNVRSASSQDKPEHEDKAASAAGIPQGFRKKKSLSRLKPISKIRSK